VKLDGVRVPASALMGVEGQGWAPLQRTIDLATAALAAEQVGGAEMCLEMSVEYAKVRKQFGRFIGSFQAIKHMCSDMLLAVESARSASHYANALAAERSTALGEAAAWAKVYCSTAYFHCASQNIQIHGGIGFTWEHDAHLYFKRAKSSESLFGDPAYHRERVARFMEL
jgi:alkylation response protein AidB-like acyl-CoA dehydrogenase